MSLSKRIVAHFTRLRVSKRQVSGSIFPMHTFKQKLLIGNCNCPPVFTVLGRQLLFPGYKNLITISLTVSYTYHQKKLVRFLVLGFVISDITSKLNVLRCEVIRNFNKLHCHIFCSIHKHIFNALCKNISFQLLYLPIYIEYIMNFKSV